MSYSHNRGKGMHTDKKGLSANGNRDTESSVQIGCRKTNWFDPSADLFEPWNTKNIIKINRNSQSHTMYLV